MFFECEYCKKKFKTTRNHEKHLCEKKRKFLLLNSKHGQVAYICYENWRKLKGFYAPTKDTFLSSKYFKSFINFVDFCSQKSLPERNGFIKAMVVQNVQPSLWCSDSYYNFYITNFDNIYTPMRQVEISVEYLYKLAAILECPLTEVIPKVGVVNLLKLIVVKKLSPWMLLFTKSYNHYVDYGVTEEQRDLVDTIVDMKLWENRINSDPVSVEKIKGVMTSLNI